MTEEQVYLNAVEAWRLNKGVGTFIIPSPLDSLYPLLYILPQLYNKSPTTRVIIVVKDFVDRDNVEHYLTSLSDDVWNNSFRGLLTNMSLRVLTQSYVGEHLNELNPFLVVLYNLNNLLFGSVGLIEKAKFKLVILTKLLDEITMNDLYAMCPKVGNFNQSVIDDLRENRPVEEWLCGLSVDDTTEFARQLAYYKREISTGIAIFGNFDNIKYARVGNSSTNCSSAMICDAIARQNGWSNNLDMSSQFDVDIDRLYNPNAIKERADKIYNLIRERSILLTSSKDKLIKIKNIVANNKDKKILIINKYPEYASTVTMYLNDNFSNRVCMNYHNNVDNVPAIDDDGNPILIKSGAKKGQQKMLGVTSQKKLAQKLMNTNKIHILSCNAAPDKALDIDVDVIIITSPLCDTVETYLYRLSKVKFAKRLTLYTLYYKGTLEERKLAERTVPPNHIIQNKDELNVKVDNNFDYCIVD